MSKAIPTETRRVRHEDDLYAWTQEQASFLRGRQSDGLDWANLAEEIGALGGSPAACPYASDAWRKEEYLPDAPSELSGPPSIQCALWPS
jgi:hypothetical protein